MKGGIAAVVLILCIGCSGCSSLSERACYRAARDFLQAHVDLPENAVLAPRRAANIMVAKNAARVDLPYEYVNEAGDKVRDVYVVWIKRLKRRWEVDRFYRRPEY